MVFKVDIDEKKNTTVLNLGVFFAWTLFLLIHWSISIGKENLVVNGRINHGIVFDSHSKLYATWSGSAIDGPIDYPLGQLQTITEYSNGKTVFRLSVLKEDREKLAVINSQIKYLSKFSQQLNKSLDMLGIEPFDLIFHWVLVYDRPVKHFESPRKKAMPPVFLEFYDSLNNLQVENFSEYVEAKAVAVFFHEFFHFIIRYKGSPHSNILREETYAYLFGGCQAYPLLGTIKTGIFQHQFDDTFFRDPKKDIKVIKNTVKHSQINGKKASKSTIGSAIAMYYFQAVANNRTGKKVQSERIPEFCEKLFTEHNFKWPIEKKPPPWFKDFLQEGRKQGAGGAGTESERRETT